MEGVRRIRPNVDLSNSHGREAFAHLFNDEEYFMVQPQSYLNDNHKKSLRRTAVGVIESAYAKDKVRGEFDALIPYTAMNYFDRFVSRNFSLPHVVTFFGGRNTCLFVICCLTLARKLRDESFKLVKFMADRNLEFSTQDILRMELNICQGLEWRMKTVTPFSFVEFFIPILRLRANLPSPCGPVREMIIRSQFDIKFTEYRPSVVAASAVIIVSSKMFPDVCSLFEQMFFTYAEPLGQLKDMLVKLYKNPSINPAVTSSEPSSSDEMKPARRPGKEPINSEIELKPLVITPTEYHDADDDGLMDFKLGWIALLDEEVESGGYYTDCCAAIRSGYERIMKSKYAVEMRNVCEAILKLIKDWCGDYVGGLVTSALEGCFGGSAPDAAPDAAPIEMI